MQQTESPVVAFIDYRLDNGVMIRLLETRGCFWQFQRHNGVDGVIKFNVTAGSYGLPVQRQK